MVAYFPFKQIKIVLLQTSDPGNIGSTARAMKNMQFSELCLVAPLHFPDPKATARAAGATDILEAATVVSTLDDALADCHFICGLSAKKDRHLPWPVQTPREAAPLLLEKIAGSADLKVALLFGRERDGLNNEELARCHLQICIPTNPDYSSLNLGQAVQVMCYELFISRGKFPSPPVGEGARRAGEGAGEGGRSQPADSLATGEELARFYQHLEETLYQIKFLSPEHPHQMMLRLQRLFARAELSQREVNILRGILTAVNRA